ncbi:TPA: hypothetical protein HA251_05745 [Candidatus Woesearchaeota archaeon]|nr:hypothetical protein [Candidatus Woesearchaeota archaeon]
MGLTNHLRILAGRQLSQSEIAKAKIGTNDETEEVSCSYMRLDDKLVVKETQRIHTTTPDVSEGWQRIYTGWYDKRYTASTYTLDGKLIERTDITLFPEEGWSPAQRKTVRYDPPGSFFGTEKR